MKRKKYDYLCSVPENEQPYLIYDDIKIECFSDSVSDAWFISLFDCGVLVFKSLTPCEDYLECLFMLAVVGIGIPQIVGKCGKP